MRLESSPLMLKHSFRTEQELRCKEKAQMVRLLGFFDVHIRPKKYSYKKRPTYPSMASGAFSWTGFLGAPHDRAQVLS